MANATTLRSAAPSAAPHAPAAQRGSFPALACAMLTHPGRVRHANQDACAAAPEHAAFVVCDGVGGAAGGEIASQLAVESFLNALRFSETNHPHHRLHHAVLAANTAVYQRAQKVRTLRGMATTLVAALLEYPASNARVLHSSRAPGAMSGKETCPALWLAHAGDSRAYRLRRTPGQASPTLELLTRDHSLVEEQIRAGILTRLDALRSPVRNVITRAVGSQPEVEPDIASHEIQPGDLYLLASDGLTRELTDPAIARILTAALHTVAPNDAVIPSGAAQAAQSRNSRISLTAPHTINTPPQISQTALQSAASALIDAANHHGGNDNITVLLLACP